MSQFKLHETVIFEGEEHYIKTIWNDGEYYTLLHCKTSKFVSNVYPQKILKKVLLIQKQKNDEQDN